MKDFLIARNPDTESVLPFLLRIPVGVDGFVVRAKETWPRTNKVYCHPGDMWPDDPDLIESVPTVSCVRRGNAIDLVLDRGRENRSMFVFATLCFGRAHVPPSKPARISTYRQPVHQAKK